MVYSDISFTSGAAESRGRFVGPENPASRERVRNNADKVGQELEGTAGAAARLAKDGDSGPVVIADPGTPDKVAVPGKAAVASPPPQDNRPGVVV